MNPSTVHETTHGCFLGARLRLHFLLDFEADLRLNVSGCLASITAVVSLQEKSAGLIVRYSLASRFTSRTAAGVPGYWRRDLFVVPRQKKNGTPAIPTREEEPKCIYFPENDISPLQSPCVHPWGEQQEYCRRHGNVQPYWKTHYILKRSEL